MKFPPLNELVCSYLPPAHSHDTAPHSRAAFGPDIDPRLGTLILDLLTLAHYPLKIEGFQLPDASDLAASFGKMASAALLIGDLSFFDQVKHCLSTATDPQSQADENLGWLAAYLAASLVNFNPPSLPPKMHRPWPAQLPPPPASLVASAMNGFDKKTAIPASVAKDACQRKALNLPLATGLRGKKPRRNK